MSVFAEETPSGQCYFEAVITGFEPTTGVVSLLCTARCAGLPAAAREFPLLLDASASASVSAALQAPGLPRALAAVEDLHTKDVRLLYIDSVDADAPRSGALFVFDLVTQTKARVEATCAEVMSMCIKFQQPLLLERSALVNASAAGLARRLQAMPVDAAAAAARAEVKALADAFAAAAQSQTPDVDFPRLLAALGGLYPTQSPGSAR